MDLQRINSLYTFDGFFIFFEKYRTYFLIGIVAVLSIVGLGAYWYFYSMNYEKSSQQLFSEILQEYNRAAESSELWSEVEMSAKTGYNQYRRSSLAPFFLAFQVDALLGQQKHEEALAVMNLLMGKLSSSSLVYSVFKLKEARMKLDSKESQHQKEGVETLEALARDQKNMYQDQALYYLGMYYESHDQHDKASEIWRQLNAMKLPNAPVSPWIMLAEHQVQGNA